MLLNDGLLNDGLLNDTSPDAGPEQTASGSALLNTFTLNSLGLNTYGRTTASAPVEPEEPAGPVYVMAWHEAVFSHRAPVVAGHAGVLDLGLRDVIAAHEARVSFRLLADHAAPFGNRISVGHAGSLALRDRLLAAHGALLDVLGTERVLAAHTASWAPRVSVQHTASWAPATQVGQQHALGWNMRGRIAADHTASFGASVPVVIEHLVGFDVLALEPVKSWHRATFDAAGFTAINITGEPYAELDGQRVAILGADLAFDEGGYAWTSALELAHPADYQAFARNKAFSLVLFGDRFEFIVDSKGIVRDGPGQVSLSVSGVSPAAILDVQPDRATEITRTWTEPALASDIVRELAGSVPVDWQILDWTIPAHRLGVSGASPIAVIQQIAKAAGAVAEAKQDGGLLIRPAFPVTVPEWEAAAADQVLTDHSDNLSVRDGVAASARFDRYYLSDTDPAAAPADRIDWVADEEDPYKGRLLVYPGIWRENLVVTSTRDDAVLVASGVVTREEDETIEIVAGNGATNFPVDAVLEYQWLDADLGGVAVGTYSNQVSAGAGLAKPYSLLRLRYRTKAIVYQASYPADGLVQFIVEEI